MRYERKDIITSLGNNLLYNRDGSVKDKFMLNNYCNIIKR